MNADIDKAMAALKAARDMKQVVSYQPLLESEDYDLGIIGRSDSNGDCRLAKAPLTVANLVT